MDKFSFLGNTSIDWIEEQYEKYRKDSESIEPDWAHFFEGFEFARKNYDTDKALFNALLYCIDINFAFIICN